MATSAGYSGTPLARKLGLRPGLRVCLLQEPAGFRELLDDVAHLDITTTLEGSFDYVQIFTDSVSELEARLPTSSVTWPPAACCGSRGRSRARPWPVISPRTACARSGCALSSSTSRCVPWTATGRRSSSCGAGATVEAEVQERRPLVR